MCQIAYKTSLITHYAISVTRVIHSFSFSYMLYLCYMQTRYLVLLGTVISSLIYFSPFIVKADTEYNYDVTYLCGHGAFTLATNTPSYFCSFLQFAPAPATDFYALAIKTTSTLQTLVYNNNNVFGGTGTTTLWLGRYESSTATFTTTSLGFVTFDTVTPQRKTFNNINITFSPNDHVILGYNNTGTVRATNLVSQAQLFFNETSSIEIMTTTTDAIIGNTFNLFYMFGVFFFFLFIFYISYRIAGGPKIFKR